MLNDVAAEASFGNALPIDAESSWSAASRSVVSYGLQIQMMPDLELVLATKSTPGFTEPQIELLHRLVTDIAAGRVAPCKFLVFDLVSQDAAATERSPRFDAFMDDLSNLIFQVPVVSVAWVRNNLAGSDLELALACSILVGEAEARLAFDLDLVESLRTYSLLAHKLGFVQAERLMEGGAVVDAATAHDLMILHSVAPAGEGVDGIRRFVSSRMRRHNSACGLYRAQRITMLHAA